MFLTLTLNYIFLLQNEMDDVFFYYKQIIGKTICLS